MGRMSSGHLYIHNDYPYLWFMSSDDIESIAIHTIKSYFKYSEVVSHKLTEGANNLSGKPEDIVGPRRGKRRAQGKEKGSAATMTLHTVTKKQ